MSVGHYHALCRRYRGRAVEIRTRGGEVHRGIICHVDNNSVFIRPFNRPRRLGGFGYGFYGPGYGRYGGYGGFGGFGYGIALGAIAGLALIPFFGW
ncbi:hypothetical protein [Virgibacillus doumboii]|uniref:hypothetical protein n=1 Tax=Virgibacillus doumboii TaxID=2697503 RepID=UPI0013DF45B7|nr:hypothetical protein [Virgibacillus doumboii]